MASDRLARGVLLNPSTHRRWRIRTEGFFAYCRCRKIVDHRRLDTKCVEEFWVSAHRDQEMCM